MTGQLCVDSGGDPITSPLELDLAGDAVRSFVAGKDSAYVLLVDGSAIACGSNEFGQLGDGSFFDSFGTEVSLPPTSDIIYVGAGPSAQSVFWISADGTVYGNGLNDRGQLGTGDVSDSTAPVVVQFPLDVDIYTVSASNTHTLSLSLVES